MVRTATTRSTKYDKKLDGDVWNYRVTAMKPTMVEQVHEQYALQAENERKIKRYLEGIGMYGLQQHHYMNFGQELYSLARTFSEETLRLEAEIIADKWLGRGLVATHLIAIARLFGISLT